MKHLYLVLFSLLLSSANAQSDWQEFLSHERSLMSINGHLIIGDTLHIAYNDGLKKITGNQKPETLLTYDPFMYQTKTTRAGINAKELLLLEAFDYDISGLGVVSLRNVDGSFWGKTQFGAENFDFNFQQVPDGIISPLPFIQDQVIDHNGDLAKLENGMIVYTSPSPISGFHEGLEGKFFAIKGDSLYSYTDEEILPVFFLADYKNLLNDPYNNSLVLETEGQLQWYDYDNFSLINSKLIAPNSLGIQFMEDKFYQLTSNDNGYIVSRHQTFDTIQVDTIYELLYDEIPDFQIRTFEVVGNEIYFVGRHDENGFDYHYVQKRTIGEPFLPIRADLSLDTASVIKTNDSTTWATHDYSFTVRNNGTETINSFAISSPNLPIFFFDFSYIRQHFDVIIEPGETFTYNGSTNMITDPSQISLKITGVNYAFDDNDENNTYIADIITLSNSNLTNPNLIIYPNPALDIINIKGDIDPQSKIIIYDINGQIVNYKRISQNQLDISQLPAGVYNIIMTRNTHTAAQLMIKTSH